MLQDGDGTGRDSHLHVKELDGDVPVPVACMHCRESTRPNLVAEPEKVVMNIMTMLLMMVVNLSSS